MQHLDLIKLLNSKALTTIVKLTKNGLFYKVSALLNIRANMNLYYILAYAFYIIVKNRKQAEIFITSLYEIDLLIYSKYTLAFSKVASNQLPLYYPYNYKIDLRENAKKALKYSPLYKISILELEAVKAYLINNLDKGFIEVLSAPYATPILFVKKPNALNTLTYKDRYLLLLIDKTLACLSSAKIFINKTIAPAELNYAIYNKEMLAIIRSFGHFRLELAGLPYKIKVYTNHKALEYFIFSKDLNSR
ncbi:unnamed protein product [Diplocarpon coronariae]